MMSERKRLGELLVEWGMITDVQLHEALQRQKQDARRLGVLLIEYGYLNATKLTQLLSHQFGLPFVSLRRVNYTEELIARVPGRLAHRLRVVPICTSGDDVLFVATDDPTTAELAEQVSIACKLEARLMVAAPDEVQYVIDTHYAGYQTEPPMRPPPPPLREPQGSVRVAVSVKPPPVSIRGLRTGLVVPSAPAPPHEEIVELGADDVEFEDARPVVLVVSPDPGFEQQCRKAAEIQGLRLVKATLVSVSNMAEKTNPIAIVMKEKTFAFDRVSFTKLSMQSKAHLVIWSDELEISYLEALFAAARSNVDA